MYRWSVCPGSVQHMEDHPMPESSYAAEGTKGHDVAEDILKFSLHINNELDLEAIPPEMVDYVNVYVDYCMGLHRETKGECSIEQRFSLDYIRSDVFGRNDFSCWSDLEVLHIVDLKYGMGEVEAKDNMQLMYYALGAIHANDLDVDRIVLHIVQPRLETGDTIKTHEITYKELKEFEEFLIKSIIRVDTDHDLKVPGDHCKFCNKVQCPAFMANMRDEAGLAVTDTMEIEKPDLSAKSDSDLFRIMEAEKLFKGIFSDASALLKARAVEGTLDPSDHGYKLVRSKKNTSWKGEVPYRKLGLKKAECFTEKVKTPAQIKKLVSKEKLDVIEEFTERLEGDVKLVHEKAKGEALQLHVTDTLQITTN